MVTPIRPRLALALLGMLIIPSVSTGQDAPDEDTHYELVTDFIRLPEGFELGATAGVAIDSQGNLIVSHRGPRPILVFNPQGQLIHGFGDAYLTAVHGTRVDSDDNIWVTDMKNHTVIKFSPGGEPLLVLGQREQRGEDKTHFNRPTDVALAPNGDFFVSDGYGNSRVVKFSADGTFIKAWGTRGTESGQFHLPHCVFVDKQGLLHVADRENDRIQVFTLDGDFVRQYGGFAPFGVCLAADQTLYVADGRAHQAIRMTLQGEQLARWGSEGDEPGQFDLPHGICAAADGTVYVTEITGKRIQKFVPQKN